MLVDFIANHTNKQKTSQYLSAAPSQYLSAAPSQYYLQLPPNIYPQLPPNIYLPHLPLKPHSSNSRTPPLPAQFFLFFLVLFFSSKGLKNIGNSTPVTHPRTIVGDGPPTIVLG
jgi:hypothetical protein